MSGILKISDQPGLEHHFDSDNVWEARGRLRLKDAREVKAEAVRIALGGSLVLVLDLGDFLARIPQFVVILHDQSEAWPVVGEIRVVRPRLRAQAQPRGIGGEAPEQSDLSCGLAQGRDFVLEPPALGIFGQIGLNVLVELSCVGRRFEFLLNAHDDAFLGALDQKRPAGFEHVREGQPLIDAAVVAEKSVVDVAAAHIEKSNADFQLIAEGEILTFRSPAPVFIAGAGVVSSGNGQLGDRPGGWKPAHPSRKVLGREAQSAGKPKDANRNGAWRFFSSRQS